MIRVEYSVDFINTFVTPKHTNFSPSKPKYTTLKRTNILTNQLKSILNKKFKLCLLCITLKCRLALQADYAGVFLNGEWRSILNTQRRDLPVICPVASVAIVKTPDGIW